MAASDLINLSGLMDDAKCFAFVRQHRWPEGVRCPACDSSSVIRDGCDDTQPHRQRYRCKACASRFDDLTGTVLAGHHQPLRVWVLCLYFMGLNPSQPADGVVQIRVTRKRWNSLVCTALATFGVTHKPPVLNHARTWPGGADRPAQAAQRQHAKGAAEPAAVT